MLCKENDGEYERPYLQLESQGECVGLLNVPTPVLLAG